MFWRLLTMVLGNFDGMVVNTLKREPCKLLSGGVYWLLSRKEG